MFKYDYGTNLNMQMYGQPNPPLYNLSNINFPNVYLFFGTYDTLADPKDAQDLKDELVNIQPFFKELD